MLKHFFREIGFDLGSCAMHRTFRRAAMLVAFAIPLAGRAQLAPSFQGAIGLRVRDDDGTQHEMQYLTKDGKLRFELSDQRGGSAVMIIDPATHQMLMLMPAEKMYMERPLTGGTPSKSISSASTAKPVFTGKKEMIAGYECEHVLFTDDDGSKMDACIAKGLGTFMRPPAGNPMAGPPPKAKNDWSTKLGAGWFPLKVTKGSNTIFNVTKIEKKPLDASLFTAPAGWQKLGGMPGMPGMRPPGK